MNHVPFYGSMMSVLTIRSWITGRVARKAMVSLCMVLLALWVRSALTSDVLLLQGPNVVYGLQLAEGGIIFQRDELQQTRGGDWRATWHREEVIYRDDDEWLSFGSRIGILAIPTTFAWSDGRPDSMRFVPALARRVELPLWLLVLVTGAFPGYRLATWVYKRHLQQRQADRIARGCCPMCGYDVRATPQRCPECGHELLQQSAPVSRQHRVRKVLLTRWTILVVVVVLGIVLIVGMRLMTVRSAEEARLALAAWQGRNKIEAELLDTYMKAVTRRAEGKDTPEFTSLAARVYEGTLRGVIVSKTDILTFFGPPDFVNAPHQFFYLYARRSSPQGEECDFCIVQFDSSERMSQTGFGTIDGTFVATARPRMRNNPTTLPTTRPSPIQWQAFWSRVRQFGGH